MRTGKSNTRPQGRRQDIGHKGAFKIPVAKDWVFRGRESQENFVRIILKSSASGCPTEIRRMKRILSWWRLQVPPRRWWMPVSQRGARRFWIRFPTMRRGPRRGGLRVRAARARALAARGPFPRKQPLIPTRFFRRFRARSEDEARLQGCQE